MLGSKISFLLLLITLTTNVYAYPLGLDPIGPIQASGSDAQSQTFNSVSPYLNSWIGGNDAFNPTNTYYSQVISDPSNVLADSAANVRIYFYGNNSDYNSALGFSPTGSLNDASLIFSNASTNRSNSNPNDPNARYSGLTRGDFVDLGTLAQGSEFNLFLASDAADGSNKGVFWADNDLNPRDYSQLKMVNIVGTNYYIIGWEDVTLSSSNKDFNDVYIVAEIVAIPEPSTYLTIAFLSLIVLAFKRSKKLGRLQSPSPHFS